MDRVWVISIAAVLSMMGVAMIGTLGIGPLGDEEAEGGLLGGFLVFVYLLAFVPIPAARIEGDILMIPSRVFPGIRARRRIPITELSTRSYAPPRERSTRFPGDHTLTLWRGREVIVVHMAPENVRAIWARLQSDPLRA